MRTKSNTWFLATVAYEKADGDGTVKMAKETYCLAAVDFTDCQARITERMHDYIKGTFAVTAESIAPFAEVVFTDNDEDESYYKAKVDLIYTDENTGKEKATKATYLVQAATIEGARKNIDTAMDGTMLDYVTRSIAETKILDVFE